MRSFVKSAGKFPFRCSASVSSTTSSSCSPPEINGGALANKPRRTREGENRVGGRCYAVCITDVIKITEVRAAMHNGWYMRGWIRATGQLDLHNPCRISAQILADLPLMSIVSDAPNFPDFSSSSHACPWAIVPDQLRGERGLVWSFLSSDKNLGTNLKIIVERKSVVFRSYVSLSFSGSNLYTFRRVTSFWKVSSRNKEK